MVIVVAVAVVIVVRVVKADIVLFILSKQQNQGIFSNINRLTSKNTDVHRVLSIELILSRVTTKRNRILATRICHTI